jgi:hypothetical protein
MEQRRRQTYEERFLRAYDRWERPLFKMVLLGVALVILAQIALAIPEARQWLASADRLEGARTSGAMPATATENSASTLTLRTLGVSGGLPDVWVKVNEVPVAAFVREEVSVNVREGDVVSVDTSALPGLYRFEIDHNDPKISYPVPGTLIESNDGKGAKIDVRMMAK